MKTLMLAVGLAVGAHSAAHAAPCGDRFLATVEPDGKVSAGDRAKAVAAARDGAAIRVGWEMGPRGAPFLVHWQDAKFVTVYEGNLFAQIGDIHRQFGRQSQKRVELSPEHTVWLGSIGTDGKMWHRMATDAEPTVTSVVSHWCLAA